MLKIDDSDFCKATLHQSEKSQGIPGIYLINLTSMKGGQVFIPILYRGWGLGGGGLGG